MGDMARKHEIVAVVCSIYTRLPKASGINEPISGSSESSGMLANGLSFIATVKDSRQGVFPRIIFI